MSIYSAETDISSTYSNLTMDTELPAYEEALRPLEELPNYVSTSPGIGRAGTVDGSSNSGGFRNSLSSSFKATAAALRKKHEPLVWTLCHAATLGIVPQIKFFLDEGANINGHNQKGQTALICAIVAGQVDAIKFLLEACADPSTRNAGRKGKPPLFHAIDAGNKQAVDLLLEHGANPNQTDEWGQLYFTKTITGETLPDRIELLLSCGADACAKDLTGRPLVILALQSRKKHEDREEVVKLLLRHGAKPNSRDNDGTPLIYYCAQQKRHELVQQLLQLGADPNARNLSGTPLLVTAVKHNDHTLCKMLLEHGADPDAVDIYGTHVVLNVVCDSKLSASDREDLVEILLQHGAHGGNKDLLGVTALELALAPMLKGVATPSLSLKIPELLLQRGADPNQRLTKESGQPTLLMYALDQGRRDLVRMALTNGANPNLVDKNGRTPLLLAVQKGDEDLVALLIQHGAIVNKPRLNLPLDVAIAQSNEKMIQLLRSHGAISEAGPMHNGH